MGELVGLIARFGWPVVLLAALVFIVIRGRITFEYPRDQYTKETERLEPQSSPAKKLSGEEL